MRKDYNLEKRKYVIGGFIVVIVAIYLWKLFDLQVTSNEYSQIAVSNARSVKITHPSRGQIYDRNGNLVVYNEPAYDLVITPKDVTEFDTTTMCKILQLKREDFNLLWKNMSDPKKNRNYSAVTPQPLVQNLDSLTYGQLQEILYRFPGFDIAQRVIRRYNYTSAANILGNIREVNADDIARDSDKYYLPGDYTGDLGVEKSYEKYLRGIKGKEISVRDARGRIKGRYNDGKDDVAPVAGKDLQLSIDIDLQQFGEKIMRGKKGAIVAIEPKTGEVLALVTSPCYDPALLVGKDRGKNYADLVNDPSKPLFDRAIMAAYPPGSTFKPSQGLMLLQEGIINTGTSYPCFRGYINKGLRIGCHGHGSPIALQPAIATSCNGYFCWGLYYMLNNRKYGSLEKSFTLWKDYMVSMGFGYKLNIDLPGESRGFIPNAQFYDKMIGKGQWGANTILSIAIGQGEVMLTPLQIANLGATIANRGYYITPHVVKNIRDVGLLEQYTVQHHTKVNPQYYNEVATGMRMAVTGGTCRGANLPGLDVCGKTGTVQNPHGQDHSVFMGFAPKDDPKIAICVYVENGGFGAQVAVPLGAMVMERYLRGYSDEIEERANKWSDTNWMDKKKPAETAPDQHEATTTQPATTASNTPNRDNRPMGNSPEREKATVVNPIRFISTSRYGHYKG